MNVAAASRVTAAQPEAWVGEASNNELASRTAASDEPRSCTRRCGGSVRKVAQQDAKHS